MQNLIIMRTNAQNFNIKILMTFMPAYDKVLNKLRDIGGNHEENSRFNIRGC